MKRLLIFLFFISFYGNSQEVLLFETLYPDDNLITLKYHNGQLKFQRITTELNQKNGNPIKWVDREWYFNGKKKIETNYYNGKKHGLFREWYENDKLKSEGNYKDEKKHGLFREWYENGNIKKEINYFTGKKDLKSVIIIKEKFNTDLISHGIVKLKNFVLNESKHGKYKEWYLNGNMKIDGNFSNNKKSGEWNYYYLNGNPEIMRKHSVYDETLYPIENGKVYRKWNLDGKEIEYINCSNRFDYQVFKKYCLKPNKTNKFYKCGEVSQLEIRI